MKDVLEVIGMIVLAASGGAVVLGVAFFFSETYSVWSLAKKQLFVAWVQVVLLAGLLGVAGWQLGVKPVEVITQPQFFYSTSPIVTHYGEVDLGYTNSITTAVKK